MGACIPQSGGQGGQDLRNVLGLGEGEVPAGGRACADCGADGSCVLDVPHH